MKIGALNYTPYQVLGEQTHKYSSVTVSGGGNIIGGYGHVSPVSSTTMHHSQQGVWVRNLETGSEDKISFGTEDNIETREGHRIIVVRNRKKIVRTFVSDTGYSFGSDRIYNPWVISNKVVAFWSLTFAALAMIPIMGPFVLALVFLVRAIFPSFDKTDTPSNIVALIMFGAIFFEFVVARTFGLPMQIESPGGFFGNWLGSQVPYAMVGIGAGVLTGFAIKTISKRNDRKIRAGVEKVMDTLKATPAVSQELPLPAIPEQHAPLFFYLDANRQAAGPVTLDWLEQSATDGLLTGETSVARRGDAAWVPLKTWLDKPRGEVG